jgi:hypothetical protein
MKPSWGWMLVWIAVVCLLWSMTAEASVNPASSFEKHSVALSGESRSPSPCQSPRVLTGNWIRSRAGPQEFFFPPMCYCLLRIQILRDHPGLNRVGRRIDIGTLGDLSGCRSRKSRRQPS